MVKSCVKTYFLDSIMFYVHYVFNTGDWCISVYFTDEEVQSNTLTNKVTEILSGRCMM